MILIMYYATICKQTRLEFVKCNWIDIERLTQIYYGIYLERAL